MKTVVWISFFVIFRKKLGTADGLLTEAQFGQIYSGCVDSENSQVYLFTANGIRNIDLKAMLVGTLMGESVSYIFLFFRNNRILKKILFTECNNSTELCQGSSDWLYTLHPERPRDYEV